MFGKTILSVLIATQVGLAASAMAQTPEFNLLQSSIALAGQGLSQDELTTRTTQALANYDQTAPADGRVDRMEQALVALNMYTPDQAQALMTEAQDFTAQTSGSDAQSATQATARELMSLSSQYPSGAQFSGCSLGYILDITGAATGIAGGIVWATGNKHSCGEYGEQTCINHTEIKTGVIMVSAGVLALIDGLVIFHYAQGCD